MDTNKELSVTNYMRNKVILALTVVGLILPLYVTMLNIIICSLLLRYLLQ